MQVYKKLDIELGDIPERILKYIESDPDCIVGVFSVLSRKRVFAAVPELETLFAPLGLTIRNINVLYYKYTFETIHIDNETRNVRINFPLKNCEGTFTKWWEVTEEPERRYTPHGNIPYDYYDPAKCKELDRLELNGVHAISVLTPHSLSARDEWHPRVSVSLAFNEDIDHILGDGEPIMTADQFEAFKATVKPVDEAELQKRKETLTKDS